MSTDLLQRAQAGHRDSFPALVRPYRSELQLHCYRTLGSLQDAEDALQEALLAAWIRLGGFEGRPSLRTWLYRNRHQPLPEHAAGRGPPSGRRGAVAGLPR